MAKNQLIISKHVHSLHPVRSLDGKLIAATELVMNSRRSEEELNDRGLCLVAPGDVLEIVVAQELRDGVSLWILEDNITRIGTCLDIEQEVLRLSVNTVLPPDQGEQRRKLWISDRGQEPAIPPDDGTGNTGSMVAIPP